MANRLIYRIKGLKLNTGLNPKSNPEWTLELNPEWNGGQLFSPKTSVQPWNKYNDRGPLRLLDETKPQPRTKRKKQNKSASNGGNRQIQTRTSAGKGGSSAGRTGAGTGSNSGNTGSNGGGTSKGDKQVTQMPQSNNNVKFTERDWARLNSIFDEFKPKFTPQPLSKNVANIEKNRVVYNADGGISTVGGKTFSGNRLDENYNTYANEINKNNQLRRGGARSVFDILGSAWNNINPENINFTVHPSTGLLSFNNPIGFWRTLASLRSIKGWRNLLGNVMEYTPFGRSGRSMPVGRAYRNAGANEVEDIINQGVFRRAPGTTDADGMAMAGTTHEQKIEAMKRVANNLEASGNTAGAKQVRINIDKANTYKQTGVTPDGEPIYSPLYDGGSGALSFAHGGKYFTPHEPSNIAGRSYYPMDPNGVEYVISVPDSEVGWRVGSAGRAKTLVLDKKTGKLKFKHIKPTTDAEAAAMGNGARVPQYGLDVIPKGEKIFAPFNKSGYSIGPSVRNMKVYEEVPVLDRNYQNVVGYRYKRVNVPNTGFGFKGVNNDSWNYRGLVDNKGNVDANRVYRAIDKLGEKYPSATGELFTQTNKGFENGKSVRTNLYEHIQDVVKSAQNMPLPQGVTRQELVESALYHDIGKLFGRQGHADASTFLLDELGVPLSEAQRSAIRQHMSIYGNSETTNPLLQGLHTADVARGRDVEQVIAQNPHLQYSLETARPRTMSSDWWNWFFRRNK